MFKNIINQIKEKQPSLLVVGDLMLDKYIFGDVERISPEAPVPIVTLKNEEQMLGGCGNVIRNLNNLGVGISLISAVGKDSVGDSLKGKLSRMGIPISNILSIEDTRTTEKMRIVANKQQIARVDWDMDSSKINHDNLINKNIQKSINSVDGIIVSDYAKGVCSNSLIKKIIQLAKNVSVPIFIDPKGKNWEKYKNANLITPNTKEAELIIGKRLKNDQDFEHAGSMICSSFNIDACLITRGNEGMTLVSKKETLHIKSRAKEIFDVSGAGDTVISAMAIGLVLNLNYDQAIEFSNEAAGVVVGHIGTSAITIPELLNLK